ncbi:MlaE family ABC transporter permease [Candidatus Clavichlamydia salmonicola]|uniref:MlaE family ABC transporter permease n=1 Tax=Candidatus Clavichlamydia salmonicola TaxID=469812 RepID=UPI001891693F|nr:ABC transporter permease [Candidatus Clavichlamydia salmonicola]
MIKFLFKKLRDFFSEIGEWFFFAGDALGSIREGIPSWRVIIDHSYRIGIESVPLMVVTGVFIGMVLALQAHHQLCDKGLADAIGLFVVKSMLTEVGPTLTAFMIVGRIGGAVTAVLRSMMVTEQTDALHSMGVDPLNYLVLSRILAGLIILPALTIITAISGIVSAFGLTVILGMSPQAYWSMVVGHAGLDDMLLCIIKAAVFGFMITSIACFKGFKKTFKAEGIDKAAGKSVTASYMTILFLNFFMTVISNSVTRFCKVGL